MRKDELMKPDLLSKTLLLGGGLLGYLISVLLMTGIAKSPFGGFLPSFHVFEPPVAAACLLIAAIIGVMSSLVPALSASRAPVVDALRSTD